MSIRAATETITLSASQRDSSEFLSLQAAGITVNDAAGKMRDLGDIYADIDQKFARLDPSERDRRSVEKITMKRRAERLAMGL